MNDPDPGFYSKTSFIQLFYGIWVNMTTIAIGLAYAFPAIQLPQLLSPASNILVSFEEESWIASVFTLFSPIGCLLSGYLMDNFGRRIPLMGCQLIMCIGWLYTASASNAQAIIIGRALTGVGCGMAMEVPRVYTTEISLSNMRGVLGSLPNICLSLGITIQAAMGAFFDWDRLCKISSIFNVLLFLSYLFLTETPQYVLLHSTVRKARKTLTYFRSKSYPVDKEMDRLIAFKQLNNIRCLTMREEIFALFSRSTCKPFGIIMMYIAFVCLSGVPIVTIWTINILMMSNSAFDVHAGYFLIAVTRLVFGALTSVLLYYIGRRPMAIISASGVGSSSLLMGLILVYHKAPSIAPQILFMIYVAFATLGYQCVPFILMAEMYPLQIRGTVIGISLTLTNVMIFTAVKYFPYLQSAVGMTKTLFIFSSSSMIAVLFLYFMLPETKSMTLQEIEEYFKPSTSHVSDKPVTKGELENRSFSLSKTSHSIRSESRTSQITQLSMPI